MLLRALAVVFALGATSARAAPLPEYPFLFTTGSAHIDIAPDLVRLSFTISNRNKDVKAATSAVDSTFNSVLKIMTDAGVRNEDIDASVVNKSPLSHWDEARNQSVADGYEVSRYIKLTGHDLSKYPQMLQALLALPNTENFSAGFDRSDRPKIEAELLGAAAKDARARAESMAEQFGRKLGPVHAIARIPFAAIPDEFGLGPMAGSLRQFSRGPARSSPEQFLAPANITISETVNVIYELQ